MGKNRRQRATIRALRARVTELQAASLVLCKVHQPWCTFADGGDSCESTGSPGRPAGIYCEGPALPVAGLVVQPVTWGDLTRPVVHVAGILSSDRGVLHGDALNLTADDAEALAYAILGTVAMIRPTRR